MKNEDDYNAGWTTPVINPKTGEVCYGGAARNIRLSQFGGANALVVFGANQAFQTMAPLFADIQNQLAQSNLINTQLMAFLNTTNGYTQDQSE